MHNTMCVVCGKHYKSAAKSFNGVGICMDCNSDIDRDSFRTGIPAEELFDCPSCSFHTAFYKGVTPNSIKCANKECKFYEKY